jgi:voltage-gated potassium channel
LKTRRNLELIGGALVVLMIIGTVGFHSIEHWSYFDGFYMVLTTITTIGYQEVHPLSPSGRVFNVGLIIGGVSLLFLLIGTLTQTLLEFELRSFFGRRRMERDIKRLSGHYIICGAGRVGRSVARELQQKEVPFVLIEPNGEKAGEFGEEGWLTVVGDATQSSSLREARIEQASGLVAAASTDAVNTYIVLTARSLNPKIKIIARASEEDAEKHLLTAGADSVVLPYRFAGHRIAQSFLQPHVLDFIDSATVHLGMDLEISEIPISPRSRYVGQTLAASRMRSDFGVIVLAIKRGSEMRMNPERDDIVAANDFLIAMGEPSALRKLEQAATGA